MEIQRYLNTGSIFDFGKQGIHMNTNILQPSNISVCGHLFVLNSLTSSEQFQMILNRMVDTHKVIGKILFKPKNGFVLPKHRFTGPFDP